MRSLTITRFGATTSFVLLVTLCIGCQQNPYGNPYGQPGYGSPWNTQTPPGVQLPPPQGQAGTLPSVPALPPPPNNAMVPPTTSSTFSNPGTMAQQQQRATVFDPFADNNAGPEIVGGRPRDYQKPYTETQKFRGFGETRWPY